MKNILVTGGAGFIGSNFIHLLLNERASYNIICLDALTYAGNLENLGDVLERFTFIKGNICNRDLIENLFDRFDIDIVVNFAAESHVDRSIENPSIFLETNILGAQTLIDIARKKWKTSDDKRCRTYRDGCLFIQVSTDEVYGNIEGDYKFKESSQISPNSPYSASKAGADHMAMAYKTTYDFPICITRCSNNYGPNQFPEKLIPLTIQRAINNQSIPIYGDGLQIRDWIYVEDHCRGILSVLEKGKPGEVYNIGSNNEKTNIELVRLILKELNKPESLIEYVEDRLGHDRHYAIDSTKITRELEWSPKYSFEDGIKETINWYKANKKWMTDIVTGEYVHFNNKYCSIKP